MADSQDNTTLKAQSNQVDAYSAELKKTLIALAWMYDQYCGDNFGHDFMGAGEDAIEILENYGLGDERKGIDHEALTNLERGSDLLLKAPKPSTGYMEAQ